MSETVSKTGKLDEHGSPYNALPEREAGETVVAAALTAPEEVTVTGASDLDDLDAVGDDDDDDDEDDE